MYNYLTKFLSRPHEDYMRLLNINIGADGKNCWGKESIFIGISGKVGEWQGKGSIINNYSICKVCEHLDYRLL